MSAYRDAAETVTWHRQKSRARCANKRSQMKCQFRCAQSERTVGLVSPRLHTVSPALGRAGGTSTPHLLCWKVDCCTGTNNSRALESLTGRGDGLSTFSISMAENIRDRWCVLKPQTRATIESRKLRHRYAASVTAKVMIHRAGKIWGYFFFSGEC